MYPVATCDCRWSARRTTFLSERSIMAARDREGVFRGGCITHPMHRFGASGPAERIFKWGG